jgi:hypothetical protein
MKKITFIAVASVILSSSIHAEGVVAPQDTIVKRITKTITINSNTGDTLRTEESSEETLLPQREESSVLFSGSSYNFLFSWKKRKHLSPHWTGIGMGFMNYDDKNIQNGKLKMSTSHNFTVNLIDYHKQIANSNWLLVSGIGFEWLRYHFDTNAALRKMDGVTSFIPATNGINYKSNMLLAYYATLPLLLEYQTGNFHVSGGAVAFFKYYSKSQVTYYENDDKKEQVMGRDLNIRPVDMKLRLQLGFDDVAVYGYYSPFSMFNKNEGPNLKTYTVGVMIGI